jgi:Fe-S cluster biogenesis protein NfuA
MLTMENIILGFVLFVVYFCFASYFLYTPSSTGAESVEPIEKQLQRMFQEIDSVSDSEDSEDEVLTPHGHPLADGAYKERTRLRRRPPQPVMSVSNSVRVTAPSEETPAVLSSPRENASVVDFEQLTPHIRRQICKALKIKQSVDRKKVSAKHLKAQIEQRLKEEPSNISVVREILQTA